MTQSHEPGPAKAELHYRSARQYRELARIVTALPANVVERSILHASAGALLYGAAKQCVNAVANLRGQDPKGNREKLAAIIPLIADYPAYSTLFDGPTSAWYLHIHADQFDLSIDEFNHHYNVASAFVTQMLAIYQSILQSV